MRSYLLPRCHNDFRFAIILDDCAVRWPGSDWLMFYVRTDSAQMS
jgi:hypothetical protein